MRLVINRWIFFLQVILMLCAIILCKSAKLIPSVIIIFLYFIIYVDFINIFRYKNRIIGFMILLLSTVRYCVIHYLILMSNDYIKQAYFGGISNDQVYTVGAFFTIWEMIAVGLFLKWKFAKWYDKNNLDNKEEVYVQSDKNREILLFFVLIVFLSFIFLQPKALSFFSSIFSIKEIRDEDIIRASSSGIGVVSVFIVRSFRMLLPIPFVSVVYRNYVKSKKFFWVIIALISFIVPYGTIFEGTSRNTIIIPIISLVFIIPVLFKEYRRFIIIFLISSLTIVSIIMIAWKNFTRFGMVVSSSDMNIVGMIQYLELYFAGPSNMGKAVLSWYNANLFIFDGIRMIPNDIFNYVPILSGFTNFSMTTNRFFLDFIGRNDQVIPAMGNGLFYFGVVFAPLVPIVNIKISRIFEKKAYKSGLNVDELTLFSYAAVMLSYNTFNNISSFYMKLTIYILPSIIICFVIKQFCNSIRRKK